MVWDLRVSAVGHDLYPGFQYFLLAKAYYMIHIVTTYIPWKREVTRYSVLKLTALGDSSEYQSSVFGTLLDSPTKIIH